MCGLSGGKGRMRSETTQDKETLESRMKRRVYADRQRERDRDRLMLNTVCRVTERSVFPPQTHLSCALRVGKQRE